MVIQLPIIGCTLLNCLCDENKIIQKTVKKKKKKKKCFMLLIYGPRQANLVLIAFASSEGSGEPAHPRSLARTFAARSYKQWIKRNLQTESQIAGPSEWLGMRSWNLSWRNARRHKFAWRGSYYTNCSCVLIFVSNMVLVTVLALSSVHFLCKLTPIQSFPFSVDFKLAACMHFMQCTLE